MIVSPVSTSALEELAPLEEEEEEEEHGPAENLLGASEPTWIESSHSALSLPALTPLPLPPALPNDPTETMDPTEPSPRGRPLRPLLPPPPKLLVPLRL